MTQPQDGGPVMTLPNGETIREGDYGVTRDGQKVGPIERSANGDKGGFWCEPMGLYRKDGSFGYGVLNNNALDIIAKWHHVDAGPDPATPNYNDGKWHAWHGGECPVHPQSVVEAVRGEGKDADVVVWRADNFQECNWTETGKSSSIRVFRVVTPYAEPAPEPAAMSHIVTLPCGKTFDLTNPYGTPYGLLDDVYGVGAAAAMQAHGGPYEWRDGCSWGSARDCEDACTGVYRVKPAPVVETITQDMWQEDAGRLWSFGLVAGDVRPVTVTFTRTNGVIDNDSYKVEVKG